MHTCTPDLRRLPLSRPTRTVLVQVPTLDGEGTVRKHALRTERFRIKRVDILPFVLWSQYFFQYLLTLNLSQTH